MKQFNIAFRTSPAARNEDRYDEAFCQKWSLSRDWWQLDGIAYSRPVWAVTQNGRNQICDFASLLGVLVNEKNKSFNPDDDSARQFGVSDILKANGVIVGNLSGSPVLPSEDQQILASQAKVLMGEALRIAVERRGHMHDSGIANIGVYRNDWAMHLRPLVERIAAWAVAELIAAGYEVVAAAPWQLPLGLHEIYDAQDSRINDAAYPCADGLPISNWSKPSLEPWPCKRGYGVSGRGLIGE